VPMCGSTTVVLLYSACSLRLVRSSGKWLGIPTYCHTAPESETVGQNSKAMVIALFLYRTVKPSPNTVAV
jgi:hypothetical protein